MILILECASGVISQEKHEALREQSLWNVGGD